MMKSYFPIAGMLKLSGKFTNFIKINEKGFSLWITGFVILMLGSACTVPLFEGMMGRQQVPNLLGLPDEHAVYYLDELGFRYSLTEHTVDTKQQNHIVTGQEPSPGEYIKPDRPVSLMVGVFPEDEEQAASSTRTPAATIEVNAEKVSETAAPVQVTPTETVITETAGPTPTGGSSNQIVFASDRSGDIQLWLADLNGNQPEQITDHHGGACQPDFSPDGKEIVFTSPCDGRHEVYPGSSLWLLNLESGEIMDLPDMGGADFDAAWSPDGLYIAFTSMRDSGLAQIYVYNVEEKTAENISQNSANEYQPAWSSDGSQLAYISPSPGSKTVMIRKIDDGEFQQFSRDASRDFNYPQWMPDNHALLFSYAPAGNVPSLMYARLDEQGYAIEKILTAYPMPIRDISISPDGRWVVYESWLDGSNHDIWIQSLDEAEQIRITKEKSFDFHPDWRP